MLETIKFIKEHMNWKELLQEAPYFLTIKEDEYYYLLKYNQIDSDFTNPIVKECRGLIIDKIELTEVALSFKKFHNIQEPIHDDIDWNSAKVQEKVDGSKILIFWNKYKNIWQICTSGNLNAYEAAVSNFGITFGDLFEKALQNNNLTKPEFEYLLDKDYCYTLELVAPESRIVVPYKQADIYFIGLRDCNTFNELDPVCSTALYLKIKHPKQFSLATLEDCLKATEQMGYDEEGFVVVDNKWNRVKIKSPAYVSVHHIRDNGSINIGRVLELIEQNKHDDYLAIFPEYKEYFDLLIDKRNSFIKNTISAYNDIREMYIKDNYSDHEPILTRKNYALYIINNYKNISRFLFTCLSNKDYEPNYDEEKIVLSWWQQLSIDKKLNYLMEDK